MEKKDQNNTISKEKELPSLTVCPLCNLVFNKCAEQLPDSSIIRYRQCRKCGMQIYTEYNYNRLKLVMKELDHEFNDDNIYQYTNQRLIGSNKRKQQLSNDKNTIILKNRKYVSQSSPNKKVSVIQTKCKKCGDPDIVFGSNLCWECYKEEKRKTFYN